MNVDIKYIAKMAGVSPATVSRVINQTKPVSDELSCRVIAAVEKYHYHPNNMARALILKKSGLIGVMVPNVSSFFHSRLVSAIQQFADTKGYNVILVNHYHDFANQKKHFVALYEHQVDGILLLQENSMEELYTLLSLTDTPIVLASAHIPSSPFANVTIDDEKAAYDAVSYLISLGHRNIAGIFNHCYSLGVLRRRGYERALSEAGLSPAPECIAWADLTVEEGARCAQELFSAPSPPTALFCNSDELAVGAINWLTDHSFSVPKDVSVIGFDDISLGSSIRPRLTTIHQPIEELGLQAAELLITQIEQKGSPARKPSAMLLPHSLVIRESCSPPP